MARFVVLEHDWPALHWDFMLEIGAVLQTWRLSKPPQQNGEAIKALRLADHRTDYLDYEGPVSGDRGSVRRWDRGAYDLLESTEGHSFKVRLRGQRLKGAAVLSNVGEEWTFYLEGDP